MKPDVEGFVMVGDTVGEFIVTDYGYGGIEVMDVNYMNEFAELSGIL